MTQPKQEPKSWEMELEKKFYQGGLYDFIIGKSEVSSRDMHHNCASIRALPYV